jgi:hypothetical protein
MNGQRLSASRSYAFLTPTSAIAHMHGLPSMRSHLSVCAGPRGLTG